MKPPRKTKTLGGLEELVMRTILCLNNDAYGVEMRDEMENRANHSVSFGTVYATLDRLQDKGFVESRLGEAGSEPGGRAKRFYRLTALGRETLREAENTRAALTPTGAFAIS